MKTSRSLSEQSFPQLMTKLRRVGGLYILFMLLVLALIHWIAQDMDRVMNNPSLSRQAMDTFMQESVTRLNVVVFLSGVFMVPVFFLAAQLAARFVRIHFEGLELMNRRKSQFVAMVSHELRTPLNAIVGFTDLLANLAYGSLNAVQLDYVKEIRTGVSHLKKLINDILDLSKIEAGTLELRLTELVVGDVLREAIVVAEPIARQHDLRIVPAGDLNAMARGDRFRIKQVLINLLSNAIKFSPKGATITVAASSTGSQMRVTVVDEGCGIDLRDQKQIFEEFRQARSPKAMQEGTGLGLAICRRLIELQGGSIWVESLPGAGTKFHFTLPAVQGEAAALMEECGVNPQRVSEPPQLVSTRKP